MEGLKEINLFVTNSQADNLFSELEKYFCIDLPDTKFKEYKVLNQVAKNICSNSKTLLSSESSEIVKQAIRIEASHQYTIEEQQKIQICDNHSCVNCFTNITSLWRRYQGKLICNACSLYQKLHGRPRPISFKTNEIKKRNRRQK